MSTKSTRSTTTISTFQRRILFFLFSFLHGRSKGGSKGREGRAGDGEYLLVLKDWACCIAGAAAFLIFYLFFLMFLDGIPSLATPNPPFLSSAGRLCGSSYFSIYLHHSCLLWFLRPFFFPFITVCPESGGTGRTLSGLCSDSLTALPP